MKQLEGKVAVVTGAGSGIGLATALLFAAEGARLVATDISANGLAQLEGLDGVRTVVADVSRSSDVDRIVDTAVDRFGRLDILCNIAGIVDHWEPVAEMADATWQCVLAVNLTGPFLTSRRAIPIMLDAGGGCIVNVSSVAGLAGGRAGAAYTASKHGVIGLTKNIAATYGPDGIRCVAVCPGAVNTPIKAHARIDGSPTSKRGDAAMSRAKASALRRAEPEEIASVILFAASPQSIAINGDIMVADGGWMAH